MNLIRRPRKKGRETETDRKKAERNLGNERKSDRKEKKRQEEREGEITILQ